MPLQALGDPFAWGLRSSASLLGPKSVPASVLTALKSFYKKELCQNHSQHAYFLPHPPPPRVLHVLNSAHFNMGYVALNIAHSLDVMLTGFPSACTLQKLGRSEVKVLIYI